MCDEMNIRTGINLDRVLDVSRRLVQMLGHTTDSYLLKAGKSKDLIRELPSRQGKNFTLAK
jgi:hydroxymethylglutaryl-CoA lyase